MSFDKFLLSVESRDLSQADKSIIRVSSFPKLFLNDKIYSYTKKTVKGHAEDQNCSQFIFLINFLNTLFSPSTFLNKTFERFISAVDDIKYVC